MHGFTDENRTLKILAGDKDIDIYFFFHDDAKYILDNNLVSPIDSDIIDEFNSKTFDCLQDICVDKSGNTIMMPLEYSIFSLFVPKQAVEELGLTAQDIEYWEDFYNYLTDYTGPRKSTEMETPCSIRLKSNTITTIATLTTGSLITTTRTSGVYMKRCSETGSSTVKAITSRIS